MSLEIDLDTSEGSFSSPIWAELIDKDPTRQIFATPLWNRLWWEEFGSTGLRKDLVVLTMRRGDEPLAIVPLYRKHEDGRKILRFVGGIDLTDYLGPICSTDCREEVAATLTSWLLSTDIEWDEFDAHNMPVPLGFADYLVDHADRSGLAFTLVQEETAAVMHLPDTWEDYESGLIAKERHELRRKRRRLGREFPDAMVRTATAESLDVDLKTFIEMHRGAEGHKGHFMKPEIATFFERVARAFIDEGWLRLDFIEVGGRAIASTFSFVFDKTFYLYNSAYEPDAARLSPGLVLVSQLVERSISEGLEVFDFLRGPERYKYQLGGQAVPLNNVGVTKR